MYIYISIHAYVYVYICTYIHIQTHSSVYTTVIYATSRNHTLKARESTQMCIRDKGHILRLLDYQDT